MTRRLVTLAGGDLPLVLVADQLALIDRRAEDERRTAEAEVVCRLLEERDRLLLALLRAAGVPPDVIAAVTEHLDRDRSARLPAEPVARILALSEDGRSRLRQLRASQLAQLVDEARGLLDGLTRAQEEREELERALALTPAEADIARVVERLNDATRNVTLLNEQARQLDATIAARRAALQDVQKKLQQLLQGDLNAEFEREDARRLVELAGRTRDTMQVFLHRATARKIDRLSELITESFRFLVRKKTLVERILIDPSTFTITLYDGAGHALPRRRLSEGEKQLFAIAMLWGLARASARPLPAVIDTPMARLDATHRQHLVERYFPNASHQVIVLSTDTEVDHHYYQLLQPAVARAYHLDYDDSTRSTVGREGYFW